MEYWNSRTNDRSTTLLMSSVTRGGLTLRYQSVSTPLRGVRGLVLALAAAQAAWATGQTPGADKPQPTSSQESAGCRVTRRGGKVELQSPAFTFTLDTADGLRARRWKNHLTGREVSLGDGREVEVDFDAADQRIWITGWKHEGDQQTTHVSLPSDAANKLLTLTLGGVGLYDYRQIEVAVNGQAVGVRQVTNRWHEPGRFELGPGSAIHSALRFGQDNILVIHGRDAGRSGSRDLSLDFQGTGPPQVYPNREPRRERAPPHERAFRQLCDRPPGV
jgi:hypothetical protein